MPSPASLSASPSTCMACKQACMHATTAPAPQQQLAGSPGQIQRPGAGAHAPDEPLMQVRSALAHAAAMCCALPASSRTHAAHATQAVPLPDVAHLALRRALLRLCPPALPQVERREGFKCPDGGGA